MPEPSESSPVLFSLLIAILALALGAGAILWAWLDSADDPIFLIGPVMMATLGAGAAGLLLSLLPTARRRRDLLPAWFMILTLLGLAATIGLIVLLVLAGIASLAWGAAAPYLLKAAFILGMALGQVALWSFLFLQLHRLIGGARTPRPALAPEPEPEPALDPAPERRRRIVTGSARQL